VLFLFLGQYNYNQPPISLREPTCLKSTLPHDTLEIAEALLFLGKGGDGNAESEGKDRRGERDSKEDGRS
jgi:hypothetical protein